MKSILTLINRRSSIIEYICEISIIVYVRNHTVYFRIVYINQMTDSVTKRKNLLLDTYIIFHYLVMFFVIENIKSIFVH